MDWWSDLWLNEGFASYLEYVGANVVSIILLQNFTLIISWFMKNFLVFKVEPEFGILEQIILDVQHVFGIDALESSHPISVEVNDPNEINELFDSISYDKGIQIKY